VNNLPRVITQPRPVRESRSRPLYRKSDVKPFAPPSHAILKIYSSHSKARFTLSVLTGRPRLVNTSRERGCHFGHLRSRPYWSSVLSQDSQAFCKQKIITLPSSSITAGRHGCSARTTRVHGPSRQPVFTGVQNDNRVYGPCRRAVFTGSVDRRP